MTNPIQAFDAMILTLSQMGLKAHIVPDALACALNKSPTTHPWLISLIVQPEPFGLRLTGHLPLHLAPTSADVERVLRCLNHLNRQYLPVAFSLDPLGGVAVFRLWLPLESSPGSMKRAITLALILAEQAATCALQSIYPDDEPECFTTGNALGYRDTHPPFDDTDIPF